MTNPIDPTKARAVDPTHPLETARPVEPAAPPPSPPVPAAPSPDSIDLTSKPSPSRIEELTRLGIDPSEIQTVAVRDEDLTARADANSSPTAGKLQAPTAADVDTVKKYFENARDALDVGAKPTAAALTRIDLALEHAQGYMKAASADLAQLEERTKVLAQHVASGKGTAADAVELQRMTADAQRLRRNCGAVESMTDGLRKTAQKCGVAADKLAQLGESLVEMKKLNAGLGKALFGLDVAANFAEFQKNDPQNRDKNLLKAISASGSKLQMDLLTSGTKLNAVETGAGVLKFGLEALGMKDSALYKTVDTVSQTLPVDIVSKGFAQAIDQANAWSSLGRTGSAKELEALNRANLEGKNGLVMQGAAMIGDLISSNGENIPTTTGQTSPEKLALLQGLLSGPGGSENRGLQLRNILKSASPAQLAAILPQLDRDKLVGSMTQEGNRAINPVADLVLDVVQKAREAEDPSLRGRLFTQAGDLIDEAQSQGRIQAVNQLRRYLQQGALDDLPAEIRAKITRS